MDIKNITYYITCDVEKNVFLEFLRTKNFIDNKDGTLNLTFHDLNIEVSEHTYKQNNKETFIVKFFSEKNVNFHVYKKLSERFVSMIKSAYTVNLSEGICVFATKSSAENVFYKMMKNKFKKVNENVDNLYFEDYKNQNYLVFNNIQNLDKNANYFELLINGETEMNIQELNQYIKTVHLNCC